MDGGAGQAKQHPGRAGGGKVHVKAKAKNKVEPHKPTFLPFMKALLYARSLKLKNETEWRAWRMTGARPANIPSTPHAVYKHDGWEGWGNWLGTGNVGVKHHQFLPFKMALLYARALNLVGKKDWQAWSKSGARPANMPSNPHKTYKHEEWRGYGHWLGTGNQVCGKLDFLPFKKALLYARSLKLKSVTEWKDWCKSGVREANMPFNPHTTYEHEGWQGYGHWLGTGTVAPPRPEVPAVQEGVAACTLPQAEV